MPSLYCLLYRLRYLWSIWVLKCRRLFLHSRFVELLNSNYGAVPKPMLRKVLISFLFVQCSNAGIIFYLTCFLDE